MPLFTFSADSLPAVLDDAARFTAWRDRYMEAHGLLDILTWRAARPIELHSQTAPGGRSGTGSTRTPQG
jgi:hypothetical protein